VFFAAVIPSDGGSSARGPSTSRAGPSVLGNRQVRRDYRFYVYIMQSVSRHALYIG
jgi:hypothetical protein